MTLLGVFRFELAYQLRRPWPWLCMAVLAVFAFVNTRVAVVPATLPQDFILNSPFIITAVTRGLNKAIGEGLLCESEQFARLVPSHDLKEGLAAWRERREPRYAGR